MDELVLIAEIKSVANSDTFLAVDSFSDFSERFFELKKIFIEFFGHYKEFTVEDVNEINGRVSIKIKGFDNKDDAQILIGKKIFVDKKDCVVLSEDTFFIHDLIGSEVYRENVLLGIVKDVWKLPSNDVYIIEDKNQKDIFVPAIKEYIKFFDPLKKRLELIDGCDLLYDEN